MRKYWSSVFELSGMYLIFLLARLDYLLYKAEAGVEVTAVVEVRT